MKNLTTIVLLFALISSVNVLGQNDPINVWLPWNCQAGPTFSVVSTGDHRAMIQFTSPWEDEDIRDVYYSYPDIFLGTQWVYYGQVGPGVNMFEVSHLTNWPYFYWHSLETALVFVDFNNPGSDVLVTTPIIIETEPMPHLTVELVEQVGTEATIRIKSWIQTDPNAGFGGSDMFICPEFILSIEVTIDDWENGVITTEVVGVTSGLPTNELLVIENPNGLATQFCITAKMLRSHDSDVPIFDPRVITTSGSNVCITLSGNMTTNVGENVHSQLGHLFPNPFTNQLSVEMKGEWLVTNILGQVIAQGNGNQTISTETWKSGAYVLRTSGSSFVIVRE